MVRLLPGVVGEVVQVGQHLRRPVLGPLPGPVVENVKVVGKEVTADLICKEMCKTFQNYFLWDRKESIQNTELF